MFTKKVFTSLFCGALILGLCVSGYAEGLQFQHVMNFGSEGNGPGQFKYVEDFAFDRNGNHLLVTDAAHAYVQVFDKKTAKYVTRFGGKGDEDYHLEKPEGIAISPDGNIFVADYSTGYIKKYDRNYNWILTFSDYGSEPGENIKSEFMDIYDGLLYMADAGNHRVDVFDLKGKFRFLFGGKGSDKGKMNNPEAAKVSSEGKVYVTDLKNNRVQVFTKDGKFIKSWGTKGTGPGELRVPAGLALDKHDNVFVTEIGNNRVQVFDKDGNFITSWGKKGSGNGEFGNLHGIIVDKETGWVYVADTANNRVQVFKPAN
ncbi:NHL repeat-containing protein [Desulfobacterales bacterium HSG2]|nr:NHL repeat-containing protein [Desulfobacterales bacterium HSG2]